MNNNLSANNTNTTTTTATTPEGIKVHTATLNTPPVVTAALSMADKLRAKLNKGPKATDKSVNPITPKVMFEQLAKPGTITAFIDAALNGEDLQPLVITASHVNRSECLKAAHAAIKFSDMAAAHAQAYGLTAPEFIRLLTKLIIQDYNPATLEAEPETTQAQDTIPAAPITALETTPAPIIAQEPAPVTFTLETTEATAPISPAKTSNKKGTHKA